MDYNLHPWYRKSLLNSVFFKGENSTFALFAAAVAYLYNLAFLVPLGTHRKREKGGWGGGGGWVSKWEPSQNHVSVISTVWKLDIFSKYTYVVKENLNTR